MARSKGWRMEPARHSLAAKGIKTRGLQALKISPSVLPEFEEHEMGSTGMMDYWLKEDIKETSPKPTVKKMIELIREIVAEEKREKLRPGQIVYSLDAWPRAKSNNMLFKVKLRSKNIAKRVFVEIVKAGRFPRMFRERVPVPHVEHAASIESSDYEVE